MFQENKISALQNIPLNACIIAQGVYPRRTACLSKQTRYIKRQQNISIIHLQIKSKVTYYSVHIGSESNIECGRNPGLFWKNKHGQKAWASIKENTTSDCSQANGDAACTSMNDDQMLLFRLIHSYRHLPHSKVHTWINILVSVLKQTNCTWAWV